MNQLELNFEGDSKDLEKTTNVEFSKIMGVWDAYRYAREHDPCPGIKYYGGYHVPSTVKEIKEELKSRYRMSEKKISNMTAKQARMVYHVIHKYLSMH